MNMQVHLAPGWKAELGISCTANLPFSENQKWRSKGVDAPTAQDLVQAMLPTRYILKTYVLAKPAETRNNDTD